MYLVEGDLMEKAFSLYGRGRPPGRGSLRSMAPIVDMDYETVATKGSLN